MYATTVRERILALKPVFAHGTEMMQPRDWFREDLSTHWENDVNKYGVFIRQYKIATFQSSSAWKVKNMINAGYAIWHPTQPIVTIQDDTYYQALSLWVH